MRTHPSLGDRLAALRQFPVGLTSREGDGPAIALFSDLSTLERSLIAERAASELGTDLRAITWEEVVATVHLRAWRGATGKYGDALLGRKIADLGTHAAPIADAIGALIVQESDEAVAAEAQRRAGTWVLGAALATALDAAGWATQSMPGERVTASSPTGQIQPSDAAPALVSGAFDEATWLKQCSTTAIGDLLLAPSSGGSASSERPAPGPSTRSPVPVAPSGASTRRSTQPAVARCWQCRMPLPVSDETRGKHVRQMLPL